MIMEIVFGTANKAKVDDVRKIIKDEHISVLSLAEVGTEPPVIAETGTTFEENALIKYNVLRPLVPKDKVLVTEDSGLEIDALNGKPGVYSRRWEAGGRELTDEEVLSKVLSELKEIKDRTARFVSVIVFGGAGIPRQTVRGELAGEILEKPDMNGFVQGFPYRALFYVPQAKRMLYEIHDLPLEERGGVVTHREKAWEAVLKSIGRNT